MDVRCERCSTEYDFDDALVSERGTTVRCTNCSHQFKVYPARQLNQPERWVVRTTAGREFVYLSLRDLQKGIGDGQVGREDQLSRAGQAPRPLGAIAELEPFFRARREGDATPARATRTAVGVAPPAELGVAPFSPASANRPAEPEPEEPRPRQQTAPRFGSFPGSVPMSLAAKADPDEASEPDAPLEFSAVPPRGEDSDPPTVPRNSPLEDAPRAAAAPYRPRPVAPPLPTFGSARMSEPPAVAKPAPGEFLALPSGLDNLDPEDFEPPAALPPVRRVSVDAFPPNSLDFEDEGSAPGPTTRRSDAGREPTPQSGREPWAADGEEAARSEADRATAEVAADLLRPVTSQSRSAESSRRIRISTAREDFFTPSPREVRLEGNLSDPDYRFVTPSRARRATGRTIAGIVVLCVLALVAGTLVLRYRASLMGAPPPVQDERARTLVQAGLAALERGDLEGARTQLAKASALAEADPQVLVAWARLETVHADLAEQRVRLVRATDASLVGASMRAFERRLGAARAASEAAVRVAPTLPGAVRAEVQVLRMEKKLPAARARLLALANASGDPENAYVLATLDAAEAAPSHRAVAQRLRSLVSTEGELGLARARLIYELVELGEISAARSELHALELGGSHALQSELRALVTRAEVDGPSVAASSAPLEPLPSGSARP
jgi:predicted Zn finger-like uncharacterized protein